MNIPVKIIVDNSDRVFNIDSNRRLCYVLLHSNIMWFSLEGYDETFHITDKWYSDGSGEMIVEVVMK